MADISLFDYVGLAGLYAGLGTTLLGSLCMASGRPQATRFLPTAFSVLFFVALTQHPLPDAAMLARACPVASTKPNLVPIAFIPYVVERWKSFGTVQTFVREWSAVVFAMNFVLCALIGVLASRHRIRARSAAFMGLVLSLSVELTQLTGFWWLYPCAWRRFDVDDVILNTAGVAAGFLLGRRVRTGRVSVASPLPKT